MDILDAMECKKEMAVPLLQIRSRCSRRQRRFPVILQSLMAPILCRGDMKFLFECPDKCFRTIPQAISHILPDGEQREEIHLKYPLFLCEGWKY